MSTPLVKVQLPHPGRRPPARLLLPDPLAVALAGEISSTLPDLQAAAEAAKRRLTAPEDDPMAAGEEAG